MTIGGWRFWLDTFTGIALITAAALPVALLTASALARWRMVTGSPTQWAWRRSLAEVGIIYGTLPFVWLTMLPGAFAGRVPGRVSLIPLRDLVTMPASQIIGNLLVFAALGFLAPIRFSRLASLPRILAIAAAASASIEVAQYVLQLDRVSSIDDVLLNTVGAGLAALASRTWWRRRSAQPDPSDAGGELRTR